MKTEFQYWLARQEKRDDPVGDFARDAAGEAYVAQSVDGWLDLLARQGACAGAVNTFHQAWAEWRTAVETK